MNIEFKEVMKGNKTYVYKNKQHIGTIYYSVRFKCYEVGFIKMTDLLHTEVNEILRKMNELDEIKND